MKIGYRINKIENVLNVSNNFDDSAFSDLFDFLESENGKIDREAALEEFRREGINNQNEILAYTLRYLGRK